jgi:hypothetical protein
LRTGFNCIMVYDCWPISHTKILIQIDELARR